MLTLAAHHICSDTKHTEPTLHELKVAGPSSSSSLGNPSQEIANPWHDWRSTKAQRTAYLSMATNPLSIPKIPSQHFSSVSRERRGGIFHGLWHLASSTASGKNCNSKADLVHLMWSCPLYSIPRQRALDLITNAPVSASLNAWACPDTTISPKHALELWEALLTFIRDPTAPPPRGYGLPSLVDEGPEAMKCCLPPTLLFFGPCSLIPSPPSN
ncbi:hypothetical protein HPB47_006330 [Ixodes persulcatus]|uniref:Uncharacterized protein n=1 Tax=Ixodes persulcatus TaxID=34615 RepID=A0AC60PAI1_IXOPE|nr:hypothetical protein HPB47_006330 [Ixodes persulcatus]